MKPSVAALLVIAVATASSPAATGDAIHRRRALGTLTYEVRDAANGMLLPAKLTFVAAPGSRTPRIGPRAGRAYGGAVGALNRLFSPEGAGRVQLRHGTYDVTVSHGIEFDLHRQRIVVGDEGASITARLNRVIDTSGWLSADLHVHSSWSRDSVVPPIARVKQFIADGVDMIVATEHNTVRDYAAVISKLGANHLLASARGGEITTRRWGHLGVVSVPPGVRLKRPRGERPRTAAQHIAVVREANPDALVIAFHPHSTYSSYFRDGKANLRRDRARRGFSFDFDAIEIFNGYKRFGMGRSVDRNLRAWFQLLAHGHLVAAVGNSDTHGIRADGGQGGYPRNYVRVTDDRAESVTGRDIAAAVRAKRSFFTTGPFVRMTIGDTDIGGVASATRGRVRLDFEVSAAPWVPVSRVTLYVDGVVHTRLRVAKTTASVRLRGSVNLDLRRDGYVVLRVDGDGSLRPVAGGPGLPIPSIAVTNPIFIDVDGNARFDPPKPHGRH